jgi:hypothetical protein
MVSASRQASPAPARSPAPSRVSPRWTSVVAYEANATGAFGPGAASIFLRGSARLVWGGVCHVLPPNPWDFGPGT